MKIQATIDQIDNGQARLLIRPQEEQEMIWPEQFLPQGTKEGDILKIEISKDEEETVSAQKRVKSLLDKLLQQESE